MGNEAPVPRVRDTLRAMSEGNIEAIRASYDHFNRTGELDWSLLHPEVEFDATAIPGMGIAKGREEVIRLQRDYADAFDEWRVEPEEIFDAGESIVVAVVRDVGRLKGGSSEVHNRFTDVWTFRGDLVVSWKAFPDKKQALEAVRE